MKRLWLALSLIGVIATICVLSGVWQFHTLSKLENALEQAEQLVKDGELEKAIDAAYTFEQLCIQSGEEFGFFEQHGDCFTLKETASILPILLEQREFSLFYVEAARCRFCMEELRRERTPALSNIF